MDLLHGITFLHIYAQEFTSDMHILIEHADFSWHKLPMHTAGKPRPTTTKRGETSCMSNHVNWPSDGELHPEREALYSRSSHCYQCSQAEKNEQPWKRQNVWFADMNLDEH